MTSNDVPDAVAAVISAVLQDSPFAPPRRQAELVVAELRRLGFRVSVPTGRPTRLAAVLGSWWRSAAGTVHSPVQGLVRVRVRRRRESPPNHDCDSEMRQA